MSTEVHGETPLPPKIPHRARNFPRYTAAPFRLAPSLACFRCSARDGLSGMQLSGHAHVDVARQCRTVLAEDGSALVVVGHAADLQIGNRGLLQLRDDALVVGRLEVDRDLPHGCGKAADLIPNERRRQMA